MKALYEAYRDKAIILVVYIREAHPAKPGQTAEEAGWKVINGTVFHQPETYDERRMLAETACTFWQLPIPALVDTMQPSIGNTYQAFPNRLYLLDTEGKIVYRGVKGPRGVNVHEGELELRKLLGITEGQPVTKPQAKRAAPSGRGRLGTSRGASEEKEEVEEPGGQRQTPWWLIDESEDQKKTPGPQDDESSDESRTPDPATVEDSSQQPQPMPE